MSATRSIAIAILAALLSPAVLAEDVLSVEVVVEQRTEGEDSPLVATARFVVRSGRKASWQQGKQVRLPAGGEEPARPAHVGARLDLLVASREGGAEFELVLELGRLRESNLESTHRLSLAGFVPYGVPTEVANVKTTDPEPSSWVVRIACRRLGGVPAGAGSGREPGEAPPPEDRSIQLNGLMIEGEGPARAMLSVAGKILEVEVGDLIPGDWQVVGIDASGVTLRGAGGVTRRLSVK